jgi:hypothetical protein
VQKGTMSELGRPSTEEMDAAFMNSLKRFVYIRCYSTYDFLVALKVDGLCDLDISVVNECPISLFLQ